MCGYKKERRWMFSPGDFVFFSLSTSRFKNLPFLVLEKRFLSRFVFASCVVCCCCSTTSFSCFFGWKTLPKKVDTFCCAECVVTRSPGKLFKRTLTYCGKRTQRYVKREREREKKKRRIFSFVLPRVVVRTRGKKVARRRKEFSEQTTSA